MKALVLSTDKTIFNELSPARKRMVEYGGLLGELHIIIYTPVSESGLHEQKITRNVYIYPTASIKKSSFFKDAFLLGGKILESDNSRVKNISLKSDLKKNRVRKDLVIRSIFGGSGTVDLNALKKARRENNWLISTQDPFETGLVGMKLKKKYKLPLQIQIHTDFLSKHFWRESLKNKARVLMAEKTLRQADCVRVVSERIKESLRKAEIISANIPVSVLPIYVDSSSKKSSSLFADIKSGRRDTPHLHTGHQNRRFIILMASRLTKEKNIPMAIAAVKRVLRSHPEILLIIVGDGPKKSYLESSAKKQKDNIIFKPWTESLQEYYRAADLFLLTSNYEGYGRSVVEAEAHGLPVIMTDVGCANELLVDNENALVVPVGNVKALTRRISELIENESFRKKMIQNTKKIKDKLISKEQYLEEYKKSMFSCIG